MATSFAGLSSEQKADTAEMENQATEAFPSMKDLADVLVGGSGWLENADAADRKRVEKHLDEEANLDYEDEDEGDDGDGDSADDSDGEFDLDLDSESDFSGSDSDPDKVHVWSLPPGLVVASGCLKSRSTSKTIVSQLSYSLVNRYPRYSSTNTRSSSHHITKCQQNLVAYKDITLCSEPLVRDQLSAVNIQLDPAFVFSLSAAQIRALRKEQATNDALDDEIHSKISEWHRRLPRGRNPYSPRVEIIMTNTSRHAPTQQSREMASTFRGSPRQSDIRRTRETEEQNMKVAQNPLAHTTLYTLKLSKKWFIEFMEDEHPEIDAQVELFAPDSHDQDHPSLVTPAACYAQWSENPTESNPWDLQRQMSSFIPNDLAIQEGLTTEAKPKLSASSKDSSFIVSKLYEPEYLGTFGSMPTVLNLTLYMMLVIDWLIEPTEWRTCAGRHLNEALSIVSTIEYSPLLVGH
ncbi:unnamed protein product [Fusarium fujikuroi]|nr:unnamed protein product [Fusarium fujikuroi]